MNREKGWIRGGRDDEDDQRPTPQRIGAPGRGRRRHDLRRLSNPHFVHAEHPWLICVPRWGIRRTFASLNACMSAEGGGDTALPHAIRVQTSAV